MVLEHPPSQLLTQELSLNSFMTDRYDIETSPLICRANQWTGFYMITDNGLRHES